MKEIADEPWVGKFYERQRTAETESPGLSRMKRISDFLRRRFESVVGEMNGRHGSDAVRVVDVPPGFLAAAFGDGSYDPGFFIVFGISRLVMVLCGEDGSVVFAGREIDASSSSRRTRRNLKLLQMNCEETEDGRHIFTDSTGMNVEVGELALRVIRWGTG